MPSHFSYVRLCDPIDYSPPGSSVHVIFQARILECIAISFSRYINVFILYNVMLRMVCVLCIIYYGYLIQCCLGYFYKYLKFSTNTNDFLILYKKCF